MKRLIGSRDNVSKEVRVVSETIRLDGVLKKNREVFQKALKALSEKKG